ncbi:MAG: hypothetical protein GEV12_16620 [Micromonosporaceae bacterium]|nr:hypothetical protein [Micromonosporaceae bacterium]
MFRRLAGATVVVLCGLSIIIHSPAGAVPPAGPTTTTPASADDWEVAGFARERGIPLAQARQRLGWQALAPDLTEALERDLAARSGGVWVDVHDGDRIKVGVAGGPDPETAAIVRRAADAVGLTDGYDLVGVRHRLDTIEADNDWLGAELARVNADAPATLAAGIRTDRNAVELQLPEGGTLTPAQRALVADARQRLGERLLVGSYDGVIQADACAYPYCDKPLRGGVRITNSGGCTGGFIARSKVDDKLYQFTAGHCASLGGTDNWSTKFTDLSNHVVGPVWHWKWHGGGDMAIMRINNVPGWNPKAWVNVTNGPDTTADSTYHISSDKLSVLGMRICITGASFGNSDCGFVTQLGVTATYGGVTVHNLGRGSYCRTGGDSGAPMYSLHTAYGLHVAGSGCDGFYQSIRSAEVKLNVNVLHSNS